MLRNIRLDIAYDGTDYSGWQRQKDDRTIQGEIERCLSRMTNGEISLHGAGRTDRGVHAENMVAHFMTSSSISCNDFSRGLNSMLPGAIRIFRVQKVADDFHARFNAKGKRYQYVFFTGKIQPPHLRLYSLHIKTELDWQAVEECLEKLEGSHDFTSFENSGSRDKDDFSGRGAVRNISKAYHSNPDTFIHTIEFIGYGFLKNMVRNFVGTLLLVGRRRLSVKGFSEIFEAKERTMGGPTAPPHGLFLKEVFYPESNEHCLRTQESSCDQFFFKAECLARRD